MKGLTISMLNKKKDEGKDEKRRKEKSEKDF